MKKNVLFTILCIFALGAWLSPAHATKDYKFVDATDEKVWSPLIESPDQFGANLYSSQWSSADAFGALLDGDQYTIFHTLSGITAMARTDITEEEWLAEVEGLSNGGYVNETGYHFLQVTLNEPVDVFKFEYYERRDNVCSDDPNHIVVYATNDENITAPTNANTDKWVQVAEITPENGNFPQPGMNSLEGKPWVSPVIEMSEAYKYLRFVVKNTTIANNHDYRMFGSPDITGVTYVLSEFQVYGQKEITSGRDILGILVDSIDTAVKGYDFKAGTDPGYANAEILKKFTDTHDIASGALFDEDVSDEMLAQLTAELRTAYYDLINNGINQVESGYYYFVNAYDGYMNCQGVTKSMYEKDGWVAWGTTDSESPKQLWQVEKLENGKFSIKNVATGRYMGGAEGTSAYIPSTETHEIDQNIDFEPAAGGQIHLNNVMNSQDYHTGGHDNGWGVDSWIVTWDGGANGASAWYMKKETDQAKIDRFVKEGPLAIVKEKLRAAMDNAKNVMGKAIEYRDYITDGKQISSNAPMVGTIFGNLIDNDENTIFHSECSDEMRLENVELGTSYGWHNLQFNFNEPVSKIRVFMEGRYDGGGYYDNPDHITIYGTNDDALGISTAAADSSKWIEIVDMTKDNYEMLADVAYAKVVYPAIDLGGSYKYLRFVVKGTTATRPGGKREGWFPSPQATGITFNLSEMHITNTEVSEKSQYSAVAGVKEAYDALEILLKADEELYANGEPTQADIDALNAAIVGLDTLYINRSAVASKVANMIESAKEEIKATKGSKKTALITDVAQLDANLYVNYWGSGGLPALIDGNQETFIHTVCDGGMMGRTDLPVEEWQKFVDENNSGSSNDIGYHNLQVKLDVPVKDFTFEYCERLYDSVRDNPNHIAIYATNDEALGYSTANAEQDQWTKVAELTPDNTDFPPFGVDMLGGKPWKSPVISMPEEFKYIRFVCMGTTTANVHPWRANCSPEVTGYTVTMSEFQMYSNMGGGVPQYDYVPEVKTAVDELQALCDKYQAYLVEDYNSETPLKELVEALEKLDKAMVDTTEAGELYAKYKDIAAKTEEGPQIGGVDSYEQVDAFVAAVEKAHAAIVPTQPTHEQVDGAVAGMKSAYDELVSHINMFKPYVWYNIKSASDHEEFTDQPIFLDDIDLGCKLRVGRYDADPSADVYAIWRLVPIEGKEGQYAIQSLGTGQYFGPYRGDGQYYEPLMSHEKSPYVIEYCGHSAFNIRQADVKNIEDNIKADATNYVVLNWPSNYRNSQEWRFDDVVEAQGASSNKECAVGISWYRENNTDIVTFPWSCKGEASVSVYNMGVETYAINNLVSEAGAEGEAGTTTLTLTKKDEFEAGEPMILVTSGEVVEGDMNPQHPLFFGLPDATAEAITDTSAIVANGMVGLLQATTVSDQTKLWFVSSALTILTDEPQWIGARNGYIDATQVKDLQGSIDKTITIGGMINGVENIVVEDPNALVNVYTIDGVMVKQNVKVADATKNLAKGVYIVGKKKVLVK